jgi:hypothetical protein
MTFCQASYRNSYLLLCKKWSANFNCNQNSTRAKIKIAQAYQKLISVDTSLSASSSWLKLINRNGVFMFCELRSLCWCWGALSLFLSSPDPFANREIIESTNFLQTSRWKAGTLVWAALARSFAYSTLCVCVFKVLNSSHVALLGIKVILL